MKNLIKVDKIKETTSFNDAVAYSAKGEALTSEQYVNHISDIRDRVGDGAQTYTTKEVKDFVLNQTKS